MSAKFSVMWQNNDTHTRPGMSQHTFRLRDLGVPLYDGVTVHVDQIMIIFRPTEGKGAIGADEYQAPDTKEYTWHTETDHLMLRCSPGQRYPLYVGDDPTTSHSSDMDQDPVQRPVTFSAALAATPNSVGDESFWVRTYRPIRDLPVVQDTSNLTEWQLELFFPLLLGDSRMIRTTVPDYRILKVLCDFSVHW